MTTEGGSPMQALSFLVGEWNLDYTVTQHGRTTKAIRGTGSMRYLFDGIYLTFNYRAEHTDTGKFDEAHGIFAWDTRIQQYRYYWFESSGTFQQATGALRDDHTLALDWEDIHCTQIFRRVSADAMYLEMRCAAEDLLLRVDFSRRPDPLQSL